MIAKIHGMYVLVCDNCGDEYPETYNDFYEAAEAKKKNGWKSRKVNGEWTDVCDVCMMEESK